MGDTTLTGIRHFNRFEIKYVLHHRVASELRRAIAPYVVRDPHLGDNEFYRVNSIYFDNDRLDAFIEKVDGIKFRRKVRIRYYGDVQPEQAYLEIKQKIDRTTQKRRQRFAFSDLRRALIDGNDGCLTGEVGSEVMVLAYAKNLSPKILIGYDRDAYMGRFDSGLRITFDTSCRYRLERPADGNQLDRGAYFLSPLHSIVEFKFNHLVPNWLISMARRLSMSTHRISKYCEGINHGMFDGQYY